MQFSVRMELHGNSMTSIFGQPGLLGQNSPKIDKKPAFFTCFYFKSFQSKYDPLKTVFFLNPPPPLEKILDQPLKIIITSNDCRNFTMDWSIY